MHGIDAVGYQARDDQDLSIVSHRPPLDAAPDAYKHFDACGSVYTKVILKPSMAA